MAGIAVEIVINAPVGDVWAELEDISSHTEWMQDAEAIRFTSDQTTGVGTRFECDTVVGPFRLTDVMTITDWSRGQSMGVRHEGIVGGTGVFRLRPSGTSTVFSWVEELDFPWYLGGPIGAMVSRPILRAIWKRNLRRLRERVERNHHDRRAAGAQ